MLPLAAIPHFIGFVGAILFGYAILLAVRILSGDHSDQSDPLQQALRIVGWLLVTSGLLAVLLATGIIPAIIAVIVLPAVIYRRRRAQRYALLAAMAVAFERRIGLIPVLLAFAAERRGYVARRAIDLASSLQAGWTLPDAVDSVRGLFPPDVRLAIRMGYDTNQLDTVFRDLLDRNASTEAVEGQIAGKVLYVVVITSFMLLIMSFMMYRIMPAFQKIFDEFGVELPGVTILSIKISYICVKFWPLFFPILGLGLLTSLIAIARYVGLIQGEIPGLVRLRWRLHTASVLETLAIFVRAGRPIPDAVRQLAYWYPVGTIRRRLSRALSEIETGQPWCESFARHRLISRADRGVLEAAIRVGNLAWALPEVADGNRRRFLSRTTAALQSAFIAALLGYGLIVGMVFLAGFLPLIKLIASMT